MRDDYEGAFEMMLGPTTCQICGQRMKVKSQKDGLWLSRVGIGPGSPAAEFGGSYAHWACFERWHFRERYTRLYFDECVRREVVEPDWNGVYLDEYTFVEVYRGERTVAGNVQVHMRVVGSAVRVELCDWERWLGKDAEAWMPGILAVALWRSRQVLKEALPSREAVLEAIDPSRKEKLLKDREILRRQEEAARIEAQRQMVLRNDACEVFIRRVKRSPIVCGHCKANPGDFRLSKREGCPSAIICRKCGMVREPE